MGEKNEIPTNWHKRKRSTKYEEEIEEVLRLGHYLEGRTCLLKIRFKIWTVANEIIAKTWTASKDG